ncbi:Charged multivesicular body protein 3 [Fasciola gigantica]|uniref:Charged multivesicular body protein 3 n=1 Tax=Fasciola gigantica TaxID=46835 RepID=A0A504YL05_FASGI|nr:Charged multivesicular body protein 3 [Fasciola gigantica]
MGLFGEKTDSREKIRKMISVVRRQKYRIQRDIDALQLQNKRVAADIKKRAKGGRIDEAKILARELVNSRKAVSRLCATGAHLDCLISELNCQATANKLASATKSSTSVIKSVSALMKVPEMQKTMQDLSKEMMKMGIIGEMIDDTLDITLGDPDDADEAVSAEIDKILSEITASEIAKVPDAVEDTLPAGISLPTREDSVEEDGEINQMQARLAALRN